MTETAELFIIVDSSSIIWRLYTIRLVSVLARGMYLFKSK